MANATLAAPSMSLGLIGLKMAGALFFLLALIFLGFYLLKKFGYKGLSRRNTKELEILSQMGLGPKKSLLVVRFLNKKLLLGVTETQVNLLSEVEADREQNFQQLLEEEKKHHSSTS
ncbi:MAG: flagellar protein FliO/FliZ [Desulfonauticus sp.]|nr:flagellar protein FliO/FliZ [Desulfonauticus sp.]